MEEKISIISRVRRTGNKLIARGSINGKNAWCVSVVKYTGEFVDRTKEDWPINQVPNHYVHACVDDTNIL